METRSHVSVQADRKPVLARVCCPRLSQRESPIVEEELLDAARAAQWRLLVDLSDVTFLSSAGLGVLVNLTRTCKQNKGAVAIFGIAPEILGVMRLAHLDKFLQVERDERSAASRVG